MKSITYYPLKMIDGLFHIWKRTEITPCFDVEEATNTLPYEEYEDACEEVERLNRSEDVDLSNIQGS